MAIVALDGVTVMDCKTAGVTVRFADPEMELIDAVTLLEPVPSAFARPSAESDATAGVPGVQVTDVVRFWVAPSL